ncbi:MAG: GNAT family N-acetyltransferase [Thermoplasmata archaeon]|nr:GNAT family N-acetyltransferase [Thermoplasmata archaeon]
MLSRELEEKLHRVKSPSWHFTLSPVRPIYYPASVFPPVLRIREFSPTDLRIVRSLSQKALRERYSRDFFLRIYEWWRGGFVVAEMSGMIVGVLAAARTTARTARILILVVREDLRSRGIGTALMNHFLSSIANEAFTSVELEVRKSNLRSRRFYQRFGFETIDVIPGFYTDGEDAVKMIRVF